MRILLVRVYFGSRSFRNFWVDFFRTLLVDFLETFWADIFFKLFGSIFFELFRSEVEDFSNFLDRKLSEPFSSKFYLELLRLESFRPLRFQNFLNFLKFLEFFGLKRFGPLWSNYLWIYYGSEIFRTFWFQIFSNSLIRKITFSFHFAFKTIDQENKSNFRPSKVTKSSNKNSIQKVRKLFEPEKIEKTFAS